MINWPVSWKHGLYSKNMSLLLWRKRERILSACLSIYICFYPTLKIQFICFIKTIFESNSVLQHYSDMKKFLLKYPHKWWKSESSVQFREPGLPSTPFEENLLVEIEKIWLHISMLAIRGIQNWKHCHLFQCSSVICRVIINLFKILNVR